MSRVRKRLADVDNGSGIPLPDMQRAAANLPVIPGLAPGVPHQPLLRLPPPITLQQALVAQQPANAPPTSAPQSSAQDAENDSDRSTEDSSEEKDSDNLSQDPSGRDDCFDFDKESSEENDRVAEALDEENNSAFGIRLQKMTVPLRICLKRMTFPLNFWLLMMMTVPLRIRPKRMIFPLEFWLMRTTIFLLLGFDHRIESSNT